MTPRFSLAAPVAALLVAACASYPDTPAAAPADHLTLATDAAAVPPLRAASFAPAAPCPEGGALETGAGAYCVLPEKLSWHEAGRRCASLGGQLAQFETRSEQLAVEDALRPPISTHAVWLGLSRERGEWHWDGAPLRYHGWAEGEPNNSGGHERCGEWLARDGRFNDLSCDQRRAVLCETGTAGGACGGKQVHTAAADYCLFDHARVSWDEAAQLCAESGRRLAMLETEEEAALLAAAIGSRLPGPRLWIGLSDEAQEGQWRWSNGGPIGQVNGWGPQQPDNHKGDEHCGEWRLERNDWNDMPCDVALPALCELPAR